MIRHSSVVFYHTDFLRENLLKKFYSKIRSFPINSIRNVKSFLRKISLGFLLTMCIVGVSLMGS